MDATVKWKVSPDVEKLVEAIVECRTQLVNVAKEKYGLQRVGVQQCDAYAGLKVVELLRLSELWSDARPTPADVDARTGEVRAPVSVHLADFVMFQLHSLPVMGEDAIRVILEADVAEDRDMVFYGNVELVSP
jgi:hypothetical protein